MKKYLTACFSMAIAWGAQAQYDGPKYGTPGATYPTGNTNLRNAYGAGSNSWGQDRRNYYTGWVFEQGARNEIFGGSMGFSRGETTGATTLYVHDDVSGYFAGAVHNNGGLSGTTTTVIVDEGVTITSTKRVIMMHDNNGGSANSCGNWSFTGGDYIGGNEAILTETIGTMNLDSASFQAGGTGNSAAHIATGTVNLRNSRGRTDIVFEASRAGTDVGAGIYVGGSLDIEGGNMTFIASQGTSLQLATARIDNISGQTARANGTSGAVSTGAGNVDGGFYSFLGGGGGRDTAYAIGNTAEASAIGGHGAAFASGGGIISNSYFKGTSGGQAEIGTARYITASETYTESATGAEALAHGGSGLYTGSGNRTLIDSEGYGASGGTATANHTNNYADASGGNGVYTLGSLTVTGGKYEGAQGGTANAALGEGYAFGGSGIFAGGSAGNVIVNDGEFKAGRSGRVNGKTFADGAAITQLGGALTINGGMFQGTGRNTSILHGNALWLDETDLTVTEEYADTIIDGNILLVNDSAISADFLGGTIKGDIIKLGAGTTSMSISNAASYSGSFIQDGGAVDVTLTSADESTFFSDVTIYDGDMSFTGAEVITKEGAKINVYSTNNNTLAFNNGVTLSKGTKVNAGFNTVSSTGDLNLEANSEVTVSYDAVAGLEGTVAVTGGALNFEDGSKFKFDGIADVETGTKQIVTADTVGFTGDIHDFVEVDFGWLTAVDTNATSTAGGITVTWNYNSLTNSSLSDLDTTALEYVDSVILSTNVDFYSVNAMGEKDGTELVRYGMSQMPDVSESSFQVNQQLTEQIAARGTEFRSMNGFASSKPSFNKAPAGVAGPKTDEEKSMQGWVRVYGGKGSRDASDGFAEYDSSSWGTVIGVDKSFGNLLVGLAGGFARTDLDADAAYTADVDTYHGSLYSTFGNESLFVDLAFTYGAASTEEQNELSGDADFDSQIYSFYLGAGYAFDLGEKLSITPEASLLASFYNQEEYDREGLLPGTVEEYDTSSYLGSIGASLATQHQIDWLNRGIAYIPEVRAHYIHEFNADPDDFTYIIGGTPTPFAVRPRDESLFRVGLGLDMWSWKYQNSKFEIDYDALFSDTYWEHVVSGKVTWRF